LGGKRRTRCLVLLAAAAFALLPSAAFAEGQPAPGRWLKQDYPVILGYGCTTFELEPFDPRFDCPPGYRVHEAIDFETPVGTPVYAGLPAIVTTVGAPETHDYGPHYLRLWLDEGHDLLLGHLSAALVRSGDRVRVGQLLGYTGDLGETNWPNLHFEVRAHGGSTYTSVDPAPYLTFAGGGGSPASTAPDSLDPSPVPVASLGMTIPAGAIAAAAVVLALALLLAAAVGYSGPKRPGSSHAGGLGPPRRRVARSRPHSKAKPRPWPVYPPQT
jgi:hypothetical protein